MKEERKDVEGGESRPEVRPEPSDEELEGLLSDRGTRAVWVAGRSAGWNACVVEQFKAGMSAGQYLKEVTERALQAETWLRGLIARIDGDGGQRQSGEGLGASVARADRVLGDGRWSEGGPIGALRVQAELLRAEHEEIDALCFDDAADWLKANMRVDVSAPATREGAVGVASELGRQLRVPPGFRVVVVATDESGAYVGVWRNVEDEDTDGILRAALEGADRVDHGR